MGCGFVNDVIDDSVCNEYLYVISLWAGVRIVLDWIEIGSSIELAVRATTTVLKLEQMRREVLKMPEVYNRVSGKREEEI